MKSKPIASSLRYLVACLALQLGSLSLKAATPADLDFDSYSGTGISSRIIGDWQFRLLDGLGAEDSLGGDFVDIIDQENPGITGLASGADNALLLEGTLDLVTEVQIRSRTGDPFSLVSFHIDGSDTTYRITGYLGGLPVVGATQSVFSAVFEDTTVTFTNALFQNIDEFRISRENGAADISLFIDDIDVSPAIPSSANPIVSNLNGDSVTFLEGGPAARLDAGTAATISDTDSPDFHGGAIVVSISSGQIPPQDVLRVTHQGTGAGQVGVSGANISYEGTVVGSFTGGTSYDNLVIFLNNNASKTAAAGILHALIYTNTATGVPITGARGITIRVYDGDGGYAVANVTVTVQQNNYAPVVTTANGTNAFNEGINEPSVAIVVDETAAVTDVDSTTLASGTVTILRNFTAGEDLLLFTNVPATMGNITGSYDTNSGVLTLSSDGASATLTNWSAALRGVYYSNTSENPSTTTRTITFSVDDGLDVSAGNSNFVSVASYNDAPVNIVPDGVIQAAVDAAVTFPGPGGRRTTVAVSDGDAGNNSIQVSLTCSTGTVSLASITGLSFTTGTGTDDEIVEFTGTVTNINAALNGLVYTPPSGFNATANIVLFTSDLGNSGTGGFLVDSDTIEINFDSVPPSPPVFTAISDDTGTDGDQVTLDMTLILHGTADPDSVVTITRVGTGVIGSATADGSGDWSFDYRGTSLPVGTNVFTATAADGVGNISSVSADFVVVVIASPSLSLNFLTTPSLYVAKKAAVKVDTSAIVDAGGRTDFGGGQLVVSIATNGTSGDVLSVYTATNSSQGISLVGTNVMWGDLLVATLTRGNAITNPLTFEFTTNATPSAVQALVREISFLTTNASTLARTLRFVLSDGFGATTPAADKVILINKALPVGTVANLFTNSVGTFSGLVLRTNDIVASEAGAFQVKITPGLKYSGYVIIAGKKVSFSGQFNTNGESSVITSGAKFGVDLQLTPDASAIYGRLTAYSLGGWTSDITGHLTAVGTAANNAVTAGAYTILLPPSNDPEVGSGWATVTVTSLGAAKLKGTLGDGQAWTASASVGTNANWPLYAAVDKKVGAIIGWLTFSNTTPATIGGTLTWLKPVSAPYFTNGIAAELDVTGSRYTAPAVSSPIMSWTNGLLSLANGNLTTPLTNALNITTLGKFTSTSGSISNLKFSLKTKAGSFSGSFVHPATGKATKYSGVLLQSDNIGGGYFLGTNRGGVLRLESAD